METLSTDLLLLLSAVLDRQSIKIYYQASSSLHQNMIKVFNNDLFWKKRTEYLLRISLSDRNVNWKNLCGVIAKSLQHKYIIPTAASTGNIDVVKLLIELNYDVLINNNSTICKAAKSNNLELVKYLLTIPGVRPNAQNNQPLVNAAINGNMEIIKLLTSYPEIDDHYKALSEALSSGQSDVAKYLLNLDKYHKFGGGLDDNLVINAVEGGDINILKLILNLNKRLNVEYPDDDGTYSITVAVQKDNISMVKYLIEDAEVDVTVGDPVSSINNNAPIIIASEKGHLEIVKILLMNPNIDPSADDNLAIILASENGNTSVVKLLLTDKRVNPSACSDDAIIRAAGNGHVDIVKLLLQDKRVNPSAVNNQAIMSAYLNRHTNIVEILSHNSEVDVKTIENYNLLMNAAKENDIKKIKILLNNTNIEPFASTIFVYSSKKSKKRYGSLIMKIALENVLDYLYGSVIGFNKIGENFKDSEYLNDWLETIATIKLNDFFDYSENAGYKDDDVDNVKKINEFSSKFVLYLICNRHTPVVFVKKLEYLAKNYPIIKKSLHTALLSILNGQTISLIDIRKKLNDECVDLYGALRGFMLSCFLEKSYTYKESIDILEQEGHSIEAICLAGKFIGAYLGLSKLIKQGIVITDDLQKNIQNITKRIKPYMLIYNC
jgi:ankyrin repeat protein